jgi:nucleotide-binding universal stress UspA family protein
MQSGRIVVGVDGSASSKAALEWAIGQATLTGDAIEAVVAWEYPISYGYPMPPLDTSWEEVATQVVSDTVAAATADAAPVKITCKVMEGNPAQEPAAVTAGSWRRCWGRSASIACTIPPAPSSSSAARDPAHERGTQPRLPPGAAASRRKRVERQGPVHRMGERRPDGRG